MMFIIFSYVSVRNTIPENGCGSKINSTCFGCLKNKV